MDSLKNITWDRLENENAITYPCEAPDSSGSEYIFRESFPTANGRGKIVPARLIPPAELTDDDFPLIFSFDTDADGLADDCDNCENDADNDIDGDGFCADQEECAADPDKQDAGQCGCGVSDDDSDGDGAEDCIDGNGDVDMDGSLDVTDIIQIAYHIIDPDNNPFESAIPTC
jgi:hypothetical protein